jgi:two-component system response regulator PilR (NtrC family)
MDRFLGHDYPGNVRELENLVERAVALETGDTLSAQHLPTPRPRARSSETTEPTDTTTDLDQAVADLERRLINEALRQSGGVRKAAAKRLGITFRSLRYRLQKLGIEVARDDDE